ncbi:MAG: hypothetical protein BV459_00565 [Thermoplasmata archaeon M11B2D]|nr:MAG: hypothetical protein BV459_00565 [Thermoplasmata archaeon M11B2D]
MSKLLKDISSLLTELSEKYEIPEYTRLEEGTLGINYKDIEDPELRKQAFNSISNNIGKRVQNLPGKRKVAFYNPETNDLVFPDHPEDMAGYMEDGYKLVIGLKFPASLREAMQKAEIIDKTGNRGHVNSSLEYTITGIQPSQVLQFMKNHNLVPQVNGMLIDFMGYKGGPLVMTYDEDKKTLYSAAELVDLKKNLRLTIGGEKLRVEEVELNEGLVDSFKKDYKEYRDDKLFSVKQKGAGKILVTDLKTKKTKLFRLLSRDMFGRYWDLVEELSTGTTESLEEALNSRVEIVDNTDKLGSLDFNEYQIGVIVFGNSPISRALIIDKGHANDAKEYGSKVIARVANPLTKMSGGHANNATIIKLNLKTGTYALPDEASMSGETDEFKWATPVKFKRVVIQQPQKAVKLGWLNKSLEPIAEETLVTEAAGSGDDRWVIVSMEGDKSFFNKNSKVIKIVKASNNPPDTSKYLSSGRKVKAIRLGAFKKELMDYKQDTKNHLMSQLDKIVNEDFSFRFDYYNETGIEICEEKTLTKKAAADKLQELSDKYQSFSYKASGVPDGGSRAGKTDTLSRMLFRHVTGVTVVKNPHKEGEVVKVTVDENNPTRIGGKETTQFYMWFY